MRRTTIHQGRLVLAACVAVMATFAAGPTAVALALPPVPELQTAPTISGNLKEGQTLTADHGTWTNSPTSYAYAWWRCGDPPFGPICAPVDGAIASTYVLTAADVDLHVVLKVIATNAGGDSAQASSLRSDSVQIGPPINATPADFSGYLVEGATLTADVGTWSHPPFAYTYQWYSCDAQGLSCPDIATAAAATYLLRESDVGRFVGVEIVAHGQGGNSQPSTSEAFGPIAPALPINMSYPDISGTPRVGATLTTTPGLWTGNPTRYDYQWYSCDNNVETCNAISGATATTYAPVVADVGRRLGVGVVAFNAGGSSDEAGSYVTDAILPAVATAPPLPPPPAVVVAPPRATFSWTATRVRADGTLVLTQRVTKPGAFTGVATISAGGLTYARTSAKAKAGGTVTMSLKPTTAGRRALRRQRKLRLRVRVTFTAAAGGAPATKTRTVTVRAVRRAQAAARR